MRQPLKIVITGASAGLGRAIADEFGKTGARVGLISCTIRIAVESGREAREHILVPDLPGSPAYGRHGFEESFSLTSFIQPQRLHYGFGSADADTKVVHIFRRGLVRKLLSAFRSLRKGF